MNTIRTAANWILANPGSVFQIILILYTIGNVIWAQMPRPKSVWGQKVWLFSRGFFQFIVTHKSEQGTFTWPALIKLFIEAAKGVLESDVFRATIIPEPPKAWGPPVIEEDHVRTEDTPVEVPHPFATKVLRPNLWPQPQAELAEDEIDVEFDDDEPTPPFALSLPKATSVLDLDELELPKSTPILDIGNQPRSKGRSFSK